MPRSRRTKNQVLPVAWDRLARQFFIGFVRTHILYHATEEPICGADLTTELARHGYHLSPGTLYPVLHELKANGYLRCLPELRQGRLRKRYTITANGRQALTRIRKQIKELVHEVMDKGTRDDPVRLPAAILDHSRLKHCGRWVRHLAARCSGVPNSDQCKDGQTANLCGAPLVRRPSTR